MSQLEAPYRTILAAQPRSGAAGTVAERPKLSCTRDTLSVLGHASAVMAVCILFQRITKYILYRFKVTGSLHFACNSTYSPSHPLEHCTTIFVRDYLWRYFASNQMLA